MDDAALAAALLLIAKAARDAAWWKDDRRHWCAYCGIPMRRRLPLKGPQPLSLATRDHVISKSHQGGLLTIPACRGCNRAKGAMSLPEFIKSPLFLDARKHKHKHQWPIDELWMMVAASALKRAIKLSAKHEAIATTPKKDALST